MLANLPTLTRNARLASLRPSCALLPSHVMESRGDGPRGQGRSREEGESVLTLEQLETRLASLVNRSRAAEEREARRARAAANRELRNRPPKRELPPCGARTRAGGSCKARPWRPRDAVLPRNGRCRMHGGLSTGPRTPEGKARCVVAALRNIEKARAARWSVTKS